MKWIEEKIKDILALVNGISKTCQFELSYQNEPVAIKIRQPSRASLNMSLRYRVNKIKVL